MTYRFFIFLFLLVFPLPSWAAAGDILTSAKQAVIVDYQTGQVLFSKDAQTRMPTSSMSKVMTMLVVFDALKSGEINLDDTFLVSEKAWRKGGSKMFVNIDTRVSVEDLIRGVIVQSGNDATIVLSEGLAGSEEAFADKLNEKAQQIGMENSHFVNASGWPDDNHYSTSYDLALMARYLIQNYPEYYKYYSETSFTYNNIEQQNRNPLLYRNLGADGIKTGHTEAGGYGVIGSAQRDGRRVIMVVNGLESERARAQESAKLLDWGLRRFENISLFESPVILTEIPLRRGKEDTISVKVDQKTLLTLPKGARDKISFVATYKTPLVAPIKAEQEVGRLQVLLDDKILTQAPLLSTASIEKAGFFSRTFDKAFQFIQGGFYP